MSEIFKIGDKVFDYRYGWGEVTDITKEAKYPIYVDFKKGLVTYTPIGYHHEDDLHLTLSFTEYDLINGGFSQEIPCRFEKYEAVMCSHDGKLWFSELHSGEQDNLVLTFGN